MSKTIKQIIEEETMRVEKLMHSIYDMDGNIDHHVEACAAMESYINHLEELENKLK